MKSYLLGAALLALILSSLACGVNINVPSEIKTGPTVSEELIVPLPDAAGPINLTISFGAGEIDLEPGAEAVLVSGTIRYNVADFKPTIRTEVDDVWIEQGDLNISGIPNFDEKVINEWDLNLSSEPMNLRIKAGAYQGQYELGGLALNRLEIADGAADVNLSFSEPNLIELKTFDYSTGASNVKMEGLGNGNISTLTFRSGAGSYRLDFSGELQRDMEVLIESGISSVIIVVPEGTPAEVIFEGGLADTDTFGAWEKEGDGFSQPGEGMQIKITVTMGAGSLELRNK
jgi:hypothetical protein